MQRFHVHILIYNARSTSRALVALSPLTATRWLINAAQWESLSQYPGPGMPFRPSLRSQTTIRAFVTGHIFLQNVNERSSDVCRSERRFRDMLAELMLPLGLMIDDKATCTQGSLWHTTGNCDPVSSQDPGSAVRLMPSYIIALPRLTTIKLRLDGACPIGRSNLEQAAGSWVREWSRHEVNFCQARQAALHCYERLCNEKK